MNLGACGVNTEARADRARNWQKEAANQLPRTSEQQTEPPLWTGRGGRQHIFGQVPPCVPMGCTDPAQQTFIVSDRWRRGLGAHHQGEPVADSLPSPEASLPAHSQAQEGVASQDGNKRFHQVWSSSPWPSLSVGLGDHVVLAQTGHVSQGHGDIAGTLSQGQPQHLYQGC